MRRTLRQQLLGHLHAELLGSRASWAGVNKKPNLAYGPMAKMHSSEKFLEDARDLLDLTAIAREFEAKGRLQVRDVLTEASAASIRARVASSSGAMRRTLRDTARGLPSDPQARRFVLKTPQHMQDLPALLLSELKQRFQLPQVALRLWDLAPEFADLDQASELTAFTSGAAALPDH